MHPVRRRAERALNDQTGVFLRCDRADDALYVTNAPMRADHPETLFRALQEAGFEVTAQGALWRLTPCETLMGEMTDWLCGEEDALHLDALAARDCLMEDRALIWQGIKRLELASDQAALCEYEKRLRRRAACCLRTGQGGGGLNLCSRMCAKMRGASANEDQMVGTQLL